MRVFLIILIAIILIITTFLTISGIKRYTKHLRVDEYKENLMNQDTLIFSYDECDINDINDEDIAHEWDDYVKSYKWINDNELEIKISVYSYCMDSYWAGEYIIKNNIIILNFYVFDNTTGPCLCRYILKYVISNINKRDYKIEINDKGRIKL